MKKVQLLYFTPLFVIIGSTVCFSTIAIIIDEQKKQVGTVKAFGFYVREIRRKYLIFGLAATSVGCLLGIPAGRFIAFLAQVQLENSFVFGQIPNIVVWPVTIILILTTVGVAAIVVCLACSRLLRCSATGLLSGSEPEKRTKKKDSGGKWATLYSKLIVNNILMDAERVIVSLSVVAGSALLIGAGFTVYASVSDANKLQFEINNYDFSVSVSGTDADVLVGQAEEILKDSGADYLPATYEYLIYYSDSGDGAMAVLCADEEKLSEFFDIRNYDGTEADIKAMGMTVRLKFRELEGLERGDSFTLFDNELRPHEAFITDDYVNPIEQMAIMSCDAYESQFGEKNQVNRFYVRLNGAPEQDLKDKLTGLSEYISIEGSYKFYESAKIIKRLCITLALITVVISLLMSVMILINLTNILVERRLGELLIMRVNGFSLKQVIGYLLRESVFVTCIGIILGVVLGVPFTESLIRGFEGTTAMYIRTPYIWVWVVSILFNLSFAAFIDYISFRKIKKLSLTNIVA